VVHRTSHAAGTAWVTNISSRATGIAHVAAGTVVTGAVVAYVTSIATGTSALVAYAAIVAGTIIAYIAGISAGALTTVIVANRTDRAARATATGISGVCLT
jgi:hypothetical protein